MRETAVPPSPTGAAVDLPAFRLSERTIARRWRLRKVDSKCRYEQLDRRRFVKLVVTPSSRIVQILLVRFFSFLYRTNLIFRTLLYYLFFRTPIYLCETRKNHAIIIHYKIQRRQKKQTRLFVLFDHQHLFSKIYVTIY